MASKRKYRTVGSGILKTKIPYKKSPKGKLYIGKTTFVDRKLAMNHKENLKSRGHKAWLEGKKGRTVYTK